VCFNPSNILAFASTSVQFACHFSKLKYPTAVVFNWSITDLVSTFYILDKYNNKNTQAYVLSILYFSIMQSVLKPWNTLPFYITVLNMLNSSNGFLKFIFHDNACTVANSTLEA
jgi:hypothetical protein